MTDNHPITVPTGSIACWRTLYRETYQGDLSETEYIANEAAQWGADQELEACCEYMLHAPYGMNLNTNSHHLRAARRPKPPSLKEQALDALGREEADSCSPHNLAIIRRALEQLDD
jgi:hypothetical protein